MMGLGPTSWDAAASCVRSLRWKSLRPEEGLHQRAGLACENAFGNLGHMIQPVVREDVPQRGAASEFRVPYGPNHPGDPGMAQGACTHEAWLHGGVDGGSGEPHVAGAPEGVVEGEHFCVGGGLASAAALIAPGAEPDPVTHDDSTDRYFVSGSGLFGHRQGEGHPGAIGDRKNADGAGISTRAKARRFCFFHHLLSDDGFEEKSPSEAAESELGCRASTRGPEPAGRQPGGGSHPAPILWPKRQARRVLGEGVVHPRGFEPLTS